MAVPGLQLLVGAVLERAIPPALEAAKNIYEKMAWSKDRQRSQFVQEAVADTIEQAAALARVIPAGHLDPHIKQALARFNSALVHQQIPAGDAEQLTASLSRQIQTTVVEPLQHRAIVSDRLAELELATAKINELEKRLTDLDTRATKVTAAAWFAIGAVGSLALVGTILSIIALIH